MKKPSRIAKMKLKLSLVTAFSPVPKRATRPGKLADANFHSIVAGLLPRLNYRRHHRELKLTTEYQSLVSELIKSSQSIGRTVTAASSLRGANGSGLRPALRDEA